MSDLNEREAEAEAAAIKDNPPTSLAFSQLAILFSTRTLINTATRAAYPLLPFLALHYGVDIKVASLVITGLVAATLVAPIGGAIADRFGTLLVIRSAILLFTAGVLGAGLSVTFWGFLFGGILTGLSAAAFVSCVQAYASSATAFERRARILGFLELPWALSALIGVPIVCKITLSGSSQAPAFLGMALLGAVALLFSFTLPDIHATANTKKVANPFLFWKELRFEAIALLSVTFFMMIGYELIFVPYGAWLKSAFGASDEQLATIFGALGIAEAVGTSIATLSVDRLGKRSACIIGLIALMFLQAAMPFTAGHLSIFVVILLAFDLFWEYQYIPLFTLLSGVGGKSRATVLAMGTAANGTARVIGSLLAVPLWQTFGFVCNGMTAAALTGLALCSFMLVFKKLGAGSENSSLS